MLHIHTLIIFTIMTKRAEKKNLSQNPKIGFALLVPLMR